MHRRRTAAGRALIVLAVGGLLVGIAITRTAGISLSEVLNSDYLSQVVSADMLRAGAGAHLYDPGAQWPFYAALASAKHGGDLYFNHAPLGAVLGVPFSLLTPLPGHLTWSLFQLLMLAAACVLVARAAPWPPAASRVLPAAAVTLALAGAGTLPLLLEGQAVGELALGLGGAYWCWRHGRMALGGAVLATGAAVAKPHLALGLIVFLVAWRERRVLAGAAAAAAAAVGASVLVVGWSGVVGFVQAAITSAGITPPVPFFGVTGLVDGLAGTGAAASAAGLVAVGLALAAAAVFGVLVRNHSRRLEFALAGATALSLVASPHLWSHDLVLLAPMLVAALAAAARRDGPTQVWPGRSSRIVLVAWLLLSASAGADTLLSIPVRLTPLVLLSMGWIAWRGIRATQHERGEFAQAARPSVRWA